MALIDRLGEDFEESTRIKGRNYFQRGAVDVTRVTHRSMAAAVQGDKRYIVEIDFDGGFFDYHCNCDEYEAAGRPCKHIWAAILEAQRRGRLPEDDAASPENGAPAATQKPPIWKQRLGALKSQMSYRQFEPSEPWPPGRELIYVVDLTGTADGAALQVDLMFRQGAMPPGASGPRKPGKEPQRDRPKALKRLSRGQIAQMSDPKDRLILQLLAGAESADFGWGYGHWHERDLPRRFRLPHDSNHDLLKLMCETGRCVLRHHSNEPEAPLAWDDGGTWSFVVGLRRDANGVWKVSGQFRRGEQTMEIGEPLLLVSGGLVFSHGHVAPLDDGGAFELLAFLRRDEKLAARSGQELDLLNDLLSLPRLPKLDIPPELGVVQVSPAPRPRLKVRPPGRNQYPNPDFLRGELAFEYEGQITPAGAGNSAFFLPGRQTLIHRDANAEQLAAARLRTLGFKTTFDWQTQQSMMLIPPRSLPPAVRTLVAEGWRIEAEGKTYRNAGNVSIEVRSSGGSSIDWFELHATADFDGKPVPLPQLLAALRKGETTIALDDGTFGILPDEWLSQYGLLAAMGDEHGDHLRFKPSQAGLLDALLASRPQIRVDAAFGAARQAIRDFSGIQSIEPPPGFIGELRHYQKEGLGWMSFLRQFNFGGCLADDMGLGKTVQVLALLESRRDKGKPSLVVVPRSLVFNWKAEATRFAPSLKLLEHTGPQRAKSNDTFSQYDVIVTTYGTLRNDAVFIRDFTFDYVILDEAQAVKNAASESAKAVRLLNGQHRLALSGTPVQNHLGELWSLFEFLNPGLLGASSALSAAGAARSLDPETAQALGRALRPFILRRTKDQVARELPERLEQTIFCDFDAAGRKLYDELRDHYRQSLRTKIELEGFGKSKIMVLEALLRLRQAACHPGLIDKTRVAEGSAKVDTLLARLNEIHEEGHKALVFSQFTSLLAIVRTRLDAAKIPYEYLDGKTRDRQERVERFQTDPECKLFLVSLKAGGLGLNLTAAEYVFLLDPWWNPAVEAQAIDRAHRIGQTRRVFAYRLITRDTVEQKVLDLQKTKRDLADAIITADNRTLATLSREDLDMLLS